MKLARASRTLSLAALATLAPAFALAQDSGWYIGGNVGRSQAKIDDQNIVARMLEDGITTNSISDDNHDTGYKLFGGYQVNKYFALESGFFDLGKFGFAATTTPAGTLDGSIRLKGINFDLVARWPITEKFSTFVRAGVNYAEAKDRFTSSGAIKVLNPNPSKRSADYKLGLGVQYALSKALGIRLEAERYRIDDAVGSKGDVDLVSLGLVYRFNTSTPATAPPAAVMAPTAPEPVAVAPEPQMAAVAAPVVAAPPPPPRAPVLGKVAFSADALYDFDSAALKAEGQKSLDQFAADLKNTSYDVITVTGHADRIGTHAYNIDLSSRRAESVKTYLVESGGVPSGKINTLGKDGSDPVTKPGDCQGKKSAAVIACLQPDRRVEVDVVGTQTLE